MHVLFLLLLALPEWTKSAPLFQLESQIYEESTSEVFEKGSIDNDAELSLVESPVKDERNLNMGRQVKMDDYEMLKKRKAILDEGNVDLMVDFIDLEMEASKDWAKDIKDLTLGDSDLVIYLEMKKKINFMENQMKKHEVHHVALKPFDKNLKTLKAQFQNLSDKIGSNERDFIAEFLQHAEKFLKEAQTRFLGDDHDAHNDSIKADKNKKTTHESKKESIEDEGRHFHPKFKYYWDKESEDFHEHDHTTVESDSVMKSAISKSRFGSSMDILAVAAFLIVLLTLALVKLALSGRRKSLHKVAKC